MELSNLTNEELTEQLYQELLYYSEDLFSFCKIIQKQIPRRFIYRIICKLYRIRDK